MQFLGLKEHRGDRCFSSWKKNSARSSEFLTAVQAVLGQSANVRALSPTAVIELLDLDEISGEKEVCEALKEHMGGLDLAAVVVKLRKSYNGQQAAQLTLPPECARKLLDIGRIKVGWSRCRVRLRTEILRCFKCLGFGHRAGECKGPDRGDKCWRCGGNEDRHRAATCRKPPICLLCQENKQPSWDHPTGGVRCPEYRRARMAARK